MGVTYAVDFCRNRCRCYAAAATLPYSCRDSTVQLPRLYRTAAATLPYSCRDSTVPLQQAVSTGRGLCCSRPACEEHRVKVVAAVLCLLADEAVTDGLSVEAQTSMTATVALLQAHGAEYMERCLLWYSEY